MRVGFGVLALALALTACGPGGNTTVSTSAAPAASTAPEPVAAAKPNVFPEWLQLANQAGGGSVYYHPASIVRNADKSAADIWVQVTYGEDQKYIIEDKTTRQTITYNRERLLFRFNCNSYKYAILERRLMGSGEDVAETLRSPIKSDADWRPVHDGGVTAVTMGPACEAVIKAP